MPSAVEEFLRYDGSIQAISRIASEDAEIGGRAVRKGQRVVSVLGAANRDPAQFARPNELDVRPHPNHHVAFGLGIHFCVGAPLARTLVEMAWKIAPLTG